MSGGLKVNTGSMNTNGRDTVSSAENLASELSSLKSNMENLMTIWRGKSANDFNEAYEQQNFQAFQQLLNELGEKISAAAKNLNQTEEDNARAGSNLFGN